MLEHGYLLDAVVEQHIAGRLATARLRHRDHTAVVVDLLFASCGIEPEMEMAENLEVLPGLVVPVATAGHLITMKLLARDDRTRPADADDLRTLAAVANQDDWEVAGRAAQLVTERGYQRDRNLLDALAELRS